MKEYYKKENKTLSSPKRTLPIPRANIGGSGDNSPTNESYSSGVGGAGNMLKEAALNAKKGKGIEIKTGPESEIDEEEVIKQMSEGFSKNDEKLQKRKDKMYEPGSPTFKEAVRMPNYATGMGGMLRKAASKEKGGRKERFKSPSRILSGADDEEEENKDEDIFHSGQMLRESGERKLKGYWYKLQNKDLYYYKKQHDEKHKGMYALNNVFLR